MIGKIKLSVIFLLFFAACQVSYQSPAIDTVTVDDESQDTTSSVKITDVTDKTQISYIIAHFQNQLSRLGNSRITTCGRIVEYVEEMVGHDYSYGASCDISNGNKKISVLMCDDNMIGKFTLGWPNYSLTTEGIGDFIKNNCLPGG